MSVVVKFVIMRNSHSHSGLNHFLRNREMPCERKRQQNLSNLSTGNSFYELPVYSCFEERKKKTHFFLNNVLPLQRTFYIWCRLSSSIVRCDSQLRRFVVSEIAITQSEGFPKWFLLFLTLLHTFSDSLFQNLNLKILCMWTCGAWIDLQTWHIRTLL